MRYIITQTSFWISNINLWMQRKDFFDFHQVTVYHFILTDAQVDWIGIGISACAPAKMVQATLKLDQIKTTVDWQNQNRTK